MKKALWTALGIFLGLASVLHAQPDTLFALKTSGEVRIDGVLVRSKKRLFAKKDKAVFGV